MGKNQKDQEGKTYTIFGHHGRTAFFVLIYLVFTGVALFASDRWENVYYYDWNTNNTLNFRTNYNYLFENQNALSKPVPTIKSLGSTDENNYPYQFFYESSTYSLYSIEVGNGSSLNEIDIKSFEQYMATLGRSCFGVYSINKLPGEDHPGIMWVVNQSGFEYRSSVILPDLNNDGVNDVMVTRAQLIQFPKVGEGFGLKSYGELFFSSKFDESSNSTRYSPRMDRFQSYFTITEDQYNSNKIYLTPKVQRYRTDIYSGKSPSANIILPQNELPFGSENILQGIILTNQTGSSQLVYLSSNLDVPQYYSHQRRIPGTISLGLSAFKLEYDIINSKFIFTSKWQQNLTNRGTYNFPYIPENITNYNPELGSIPMSPALSTLPITLKAFGDCFLINYMITGAYITRNTETTFENFPQDLFIESNVFIKNNGEMAWGLVGQLLIHEDYSDCSPEHPDLYPIFQVLPTGNNLLISRINATSGQRMASTKLDLGTIPSRYNNYDVVICKEKYRNSSIPIDWIDADILVVHFVNQNNVYYDARLNVENTYQIATHRISMNPYDTEILSSTDLQFKKINQDLKITPSNVDFDHDGYLDFIIEFISSRSFDIISGVGRKLYSRNFFSQNILSKQDGISYQGRYYDSAIHYQLYTKWMYSVEFFIELDDILFFFADPGDKSNLRISAIQIEPEHLVYYEDVNSYSGKEDFLHFFSFSKYLLIAINALAIICIVIIFINRKKVTVKPLNITPKLRQQLYISGGVLLFIFWFLFMVILNDVRIDPKYTDIYISGKTSLYWLFIVYPAAFILFAVIPQLYLWAAPLFAEKFYFKLHKAYFDRLKQKGERDHEVLVMHIEDRRKVHESSYYLRSILPLLMSLTIGMYIYNGLSGNGAIYAFLNRIFTNLAPLTHPENLGVWTIGITTIDLFWLEIGNYARYMIFGMLIGYLLTVIIIAPAWLLDDSGVVFYNHNNRFREITDIDSVSGWILRVSTSALFITTLTSWYTMFSPMFSNFSNLANALKPYYESVGQEMAIIVLALIVYPIIASWAILIAANQKMEQNLVIIARKLFDRMKAAGVDIMSKDIRSLLVAREKAKPWTEEIELDGKFIISHKEESKLISNSPSLISMNKLSQNDLTQQLSVNRKSPEDLSSNSSVPPFPSTFESPFKIPSQIEQSQNNIDTQKPGNLNEPNSGEGIFNDAPSTKPPWVQPETPFDQINSNHEKKSEEDTIPQWDALGLVPPWKKKEDNDINSTNGGNNNA
jgi:hypothetical protein